MPFLAPFFLFLKILRGSTNVFQRAAHFEPRSVQWYLQMLRGILFFPSWCPIPLQPAPHTRRNHLSSALLQNSSLPPFLQETGASDFLSHPNTLFRLFFLLPRGSLRLAVFVKPPSFSAPLPLTFGMRISWGFEPGLSVKDF